jgi:hypothetical protein
MSKEQPAPEQEESPLIEATRDLMRYVHTTATREPGDMRMGEGEWNKLKQLDESFGELMIVNKHGTLPTLDIEFPDRLPHSRLAFRNMVGFKGPFEAASIKPYWWLQDYKRWSIQMRNFVEETKGIEAKAKAV